MLVGRYFIGAILVLFLSSSMNLCQTPDGFNTNVYVKETFYSPVPILQNIDSYSILLEFSNMMVDKTLLIKQLLECDSKVIIIALPRGFGKTVNMEMLKAFLEIQVDEWAVEILPKNRTVNYRMFYEAVYVSESMAEIHKFLTPSLLIASHSDLFDQYHGQRAVIHLKFEQSIDITYKEFYLELRKSIRQAFMEHEYLLNVYKDVYFYKNGTEDEIQTAKRRMDLFNERISLVADERAVIESIYQLSQLLAEFFDRPVVIMIDEYDHLLLQVFKWVLDAPEGLRYRDIGLELRVVDFFRKWFGRIIDDNVFCEKAILNGRTLFCKDRVFAEIEDYLAIDAFTNPFNEFYGFTEREVGMLFDYADVPQNLRLDARFWYYGYNLNLFSQLTVYNPFAVASFLAADQRISNYWENEYALLYSRDIRRLFQFESLRLFYTELIRNATVPVSLSDLRIDSNDRVHLANLLSAKNPIFRINDPSSSTIIKELCVAGYLTNSGLSADGDVYLRFPNMESVSVCARILNVSFGNYSWLDNPTFFRFAPEYYDEMENIEKRIRTRRPNVVFHTPSRAPKYRKPSTKETYFIITSTAYPMTGKMKIKLEYNKQMRMPKPSITSDQIEESEEY